MAERKPDAKRANVSILLIIVIGYVIGLLLKRVQLGLIIGVVLGLLSASIAARRR